MAMRIVGFKAIDFKKIKVIDITPNEFVNRISGANGSGKTSALDAIEVCLRGTRNVPSKPVRKGAQKSIIEVGIGSDGKAEWIVRRSFTEGGSKNGFLTVEPTDGKSRLQGPQEFLNKLVGPNSFDPLEFIRMGAKEQFETVYRIVLPDVDPKSLDIEKNPDYLKRRELKKEIKALETRRDAIQIPDNLPMEKHDEAKLLKELGEVGEHNARIEREKRQREEIQRKTDELIKNVEAKEERIKALRAQIATLEAEAKEDRAIYAGTLKTIAKWEPLAEPKDAAHYTEAITKARILNAAIDRRGQRDELQKEIDGISKRVDTISVALDELEAKQTKAIEEAKFPIPGLAFGNEEVIFEGIPFSQVSNADQIRASVAIGMADNPELRVMRIKDGSLLDDASMKIIADMCVKEDFQLFCEIVDTSGDVGVYLEEGEVKAVNDEPEPQHGGDEKPVAKRTKKVSTSAKKTAGLAG
jgi:DNA repair exonuclease SbcCD ATPase subunit